MNYFFRAEKMTVGYHNKPLIENVEFVLKKGEILTLIGPNGAGKSTILKSLTGQLELIAGTVYIGEGELLKMPGKPAVTEDGGRLYEAAALGADDL